jgi:hypothetical protein
VSSRLVHIALVALAWLPSATASAQAIRGTVVDSVSGAPVADVVVSLSSAAGDPIETTPTDSAGRFELRAEVAGLYLLRTTHIGYDSTTSGPIEIASDRVTTIVIRIAPRPFPVEPLAVESAAMVPRLVREGFYHRRRFRIGHFLTRAQIRERGVTRTMDLLRGLPGARVIDGGTGGAGVVMRGGATMMIGDGCRTAIAIDGVVVHGGAGGGSDGLPHPDEIEAIEVYTGATVLPPGIGGNAMAPCGAILIWTRR